LPPLVFVAEVPGLPMGMFPFLPMVPAPVLPVMPAPVLPVIAVPVLPTVALPVLPIGVPAVVTGREFPGLIAVVVVWVGIGGLLVEGRTAGVMTWGVLGFGRGGRVFGFCCAALMAVIGPASNRRSSTDFRRISLLVEKLFIANSWRSDAL